LNLLSAKLDSLDEEKTWVVEVEEEGNFPKFRYLFEGNQVYWTGKIPKNNNKEDFKLKIDTSGYLLNVVFNADKSGYIYSDDLTNGKKKKIGRTSRLKEKAIDFWTKGIFLRSEHIIINTENGFISFLKMTPYREFLGACVWAK